MEERAKQRKLLVGRAQGSKEHDLLEELQGEARGSRERGRVV